MECKFSFSVLPFAAMIIEVVATLITTLEGYKRH